jgi:hypothetical protein
MRLSGESPFADDAIFVLGIFVGAGSAGWDGGEREQQSEPGI